MILDKYNEFCDNVLLNTGAAGTYTLGNQIDISNLRDIAQGTPMYLVAVVTVAATSGGAATLQLSLASDDNAALTSPTVHLTTPAFALASLTVGKVLAVVALPLEGNTYERFVGVQQITGVAAFTGGRIDAFLTMNPYVWKAYADGVN